MGVGNLYSNKWLSATCPVANNFVVNKSHTKYFIFYKLAEKNVIELNNDMSKIKNNINKMITDIEALNNAIDAEDFKKHVNNLKTALTQSVNAIDSNMTKLFTSCVNRLKSSAATDSWFGTSANAYARNIEDNILSKR